MNVSLTPELERFVQEKLSSGLYRSASEVVREGLRLLYEQEKWAGAIQALRQDRLKLLIAYSTVADRIPILVFSAGEGPHRRARHNLADVRARARESGHVSRGW